MLSRDKFMRRKIGFILAQILHRFSQVLRLAVVLKMSQMSFDGVGAGFDDIFHNSLLVIRLGLALLYGDGIFRTGAYAGAQPVAEQVADKTRLTVDNLQSPLRTVRDAESASRAPGRVDSDDFTPGDHTFLLALFFPGINTLLPWLCVTTAVKAFTISGSNFVPASFAMISIDFSRL